MTSPSAGWRSQRHSPVCEDCCTRCNIDGDETRTLRDVAPANSLPLVTRAARLVVAGVRTLLLGGSDPRVTRSSLAAWVVFALAAGLGQVQRSTVERHVGGAMLLAVVPLVWSFVTRRPATAFLGYGLLAVASLARVAAAPFIYPLERWDSVAIIAAAWGMYTGILYRRVRASYRLWHPDLHPADRL